MTNAVDIQSLTGLSTAEAAVRLKAEGYNELPSARPRSLLAIVWGVVREPMFLLLVACSAIYLILGDREEALMLLGFVLVVMGITLYQKRKTERALEALRDLSSPCALVVLAMYAGVLASGQSEGEARALAYTTLIIANLGLILTNRSWTRTVWQTLRTPNTALWWVIMSIGNVADRLTD